MHGNSTSKQIKKGYLESRWNHIKTLPYSNNGLINDSYMIKYKKIIEDDKKNKENVKHKTPKPRIIKNDTKSEKPKPDTVVKEEPTTVVSNRKGKNSKLIFGK
jgi:hypothetical protein